MKTRIEEMAYKIGYRDEQAAARFGGHADAVPTDEEIAGWQRRHKRAPSSVDEIRAAYNQGVEDARQN